MAANKKMTMTMTMRKTWNQVILLFVIVVSGNENIPQKTVMIIMRRTMRVTWKKEKEQSKNEGRLVDLIRAKEEQQMMK